MKVQHTSSDSLSTQITLEIKQEDYAPEVESRLKKYRRQASMPGFRPGKVPMGMIKKMYGSNLKLEVINEVLSKELSNYIEGQNIQVLGEPMPIRDDQEIDFQTQEDFTFTFETALSPDLTDILTLNKKIKATLQYPEVTEEAIQKRIDEHASQYGEVKEQASLEDEKCLVRGNLVQLDEKNKELPNGLQKEDALISVENIKDKRIQKKFFGKTVGETITINLVKAFKNEAETAHLLGIDKSELEALAETNFALQINKITLFSAAEKNQELYTKVYGEEKAPDEATYLACVKDELISTGKEQGEYLLMKQIREKLTDKLKEVTFADDILKRWLLHKDENLSQEELDKSYPDMVEGFKWELIKNHVLATQDLKIEQVDFLNAAKEMTKMQFAQYGIPMNDSTMLEAYAMNLLKDEKMASHIQNFALENKVMNCIKELIKIEEKEVSEKEFEKLFQA